MVIAKALYFTTVLKETKTLAFICPEFFTT